MGVNINKSGSKLDVQEPVKTDQYYQAKERTEPTGITGYGLYYVDSSGKPRMKSSSGVNYDLSVTGAIGPTGPTGATGATGPTGAGGAQPTETISDATTTITDGDGKYTLLVDASSNDCLINLPTVGDNDDRILEFKIIDTNNGTYTVTVRPESGQTLDQYTYASPWTSSTQWDSIRIKSDGNAWYIL